MGGGAWGRGARARRVPGGPRRGRVQAGWPLTRVLGWPRRARGDPGAAERRPLPSAARSAEGLRVRAPPAPLGPGRFAACRSAGPDSTTLGRLPAQSSPGSGITPLVPLLGRSGRGGRVGASRLGYPGLHSLAKLPHAGLRGPKGLLSSGSPFFFLSLWSCLCAVVLPPPPPLPRPSPLPPHVGTAPLGQAFFLSSSSSCLEKAPIFFFLSFHLHDIIITSPLLQR